MTYGLRKELVTAAVAIPLVFAASGCASPQEQEPSASTPSTTASAPVISEPTPVDTAVVDSASTEGDAPATASSDPATPRPAAGGKTTADGVYTRAQAARGESTFQTICSACHNAQDFRGTHFSQNWGSRTLGDIHEFITQMMPMDAPGSLTMQEYTDVIAFFMSQNGYPAGQTELPTSTEALKQIKISPPPATGD